MQTTLTPTVMRSQLLSYYTLNEKHTNIRNSIYRGPQCLRFLKIVQLCQPKICWSDSIILTYYCETQKMLNTRTWKYNLTEDYLLISVEIKITFFFRETSIFYQLPPFDEENLSPPLENSIAPLYKVKFT